MLLVLLPRRKVTQKVCPSVSGDTEDIVKITKEESEVGDMEENSVEEFLTSNDGPLLKAPPTIMRNCNEQAAGCHP